MKPATNAIIAIVAIAALSGCGKTAPAATVAPIDSVFTKKPADSAKLEIARQQQEREDGDTDAPETTRVGGPSNENKGFRRD